MFVSLERYGCASVSIKFQVRSVAIMTVDALPSVMYLVCNSISIPSISDGVDTLGVELLY